MNTLIVATLTALAAAEQMPTLIPVSNGGASCWKLAYGRGVGHPISSCDGYYPENTDKDGELCYNSCREGYGGVGPVCW